MTTRHQAAIDILTEAGVKPSYQRIQVLEQMLEHGGHQTVEAIHRALADVRPAIARATVYNTLNHFVEHGLLDRFNIDRMDSRFDLRLERHGHFVCTRCDTIYDIPFPCSGPYPGVEGFRIEHETFVLRGSCPGCLEQIDQPPAETPVH